ncbi:MAG: amylo-alpha-1,6-glucosidase [Candidatus Paceibacterales bacterium]
MVLGLKKEIIKRKVLREIQQLKDKKGFLKTGLPKFNRLFGRDSLISAWQLLDRKPGICQATLEILSQLQGKVFNDNREEEPGKIIHETDLEKSHHPKNYFPFPYYGSIDSTPLFLILFSFYYKKTKNIRFLNSHWENILKSLHWIEECGDKDKDFFLEYQRKNPKGLFHQGWKDSFDNHLKIKPPVAIVEVQGYQYLALKEVSEIAKVKKDWDLAKKLKERAKNLKEKFNEKFWMEGKKYFALALDGKKQQRKAITSNPGHLLFTGIVREDKINFVVKRLFEKDLFTPFGIRNHSSLEPDFDAKSYHLGSIWPHDNWIVAQGLEKLGFKKKYQKIKKAMILAYEKIGFLPEFYGVVNGKVTLDMRKNPCYPQAWSSGALFNFLSD